MKDYEKKIVSELLKMAYDKFSNHGCNDTPDEILKLMTESERKELSKDMAIEDGKLEDWEAGDIDNTGYDFCLMSYFADKILKA